MAHPRRARNREETVDVLCGCGWRRLRCPESEAPRACPLCETPFDREVFVENPSDLMRCQGCGRETSGRWGLCSACGSTSRNPHAGDVVGWTFNGASYCTEHKPTARSRHGDRPVALLDVQDDGWEEMTCDVCHELLGDVEGVVRNPRDRVREEAERRVFARAAQDLRREEAENASAARWGQRPMPMPDVVDAGVFCSICDARLQRDLSGVTYCRRCEMFGNPKGRPKNFLRKPLSPSEEIRRSIMNLEEAYAQGSISGSDFNSGMQHLRQRLQHLEDLGQRRNPQHSVESHAARRLKRRAEREAFAEAAEELRRGASRPVRAMPMLTDDEFSRSATPTPYRVDAWCPCGWSRTGVMQEVLPDLCPSCECEIAIRPFAMNGRRRNAWSFAVGSTPDARLWRCPACRTLNAWNWSDAEAAEKHLEQKVVVAHGSAFDNVCGECGTDFVERSSPIRARAYAHENPRRRETRAERERREYALRRHDETWGGIGRRHSSPPSGLKSCAWCEAMTDHDSTEHKEIGNVQALERTRRLQAKRIGVPVSRVRHCPRCNGERWIYKGNTDEKIRCPECRRSVRRNISASTGNSVVVEVDIGLDDSIDDVMADPNVTDEQIDAALAGFDPARTFAVRRDVEAILERAKLPIICGSSEVDGVIRLAYEIPSTHNPRIVANALRKYFKGQKDVRVSVA